MSYRYILTQSKRLPRGEGISRARVNRFGKTSGQPTEAASLFAEAASLFAEAASLFAEAASLFAEAASLFAEAASLFEEAAVSSGSPFQTGR